LTDLEFRARYVIPLSKGILPENGNDHDGDCEGTGDHSAARSRPAGIVPGSKVDFQRSADGSVVLVRADNKRPRSRFVSLRGDAGKRIGTDARRLSTSMF
jgi:hypothetical protein